MKLHSHTMIHGTHTHTHTHTSKHLHTHAHRCKHTLMHTYACAHKHAHMCKHRHTCSQHTCTYTCIHTHMRTRARAHTNWREKGACRLCHLPLLLFLSHGATGSSNTVNSQQASAQTLPKGSLIQQESTLTTHPPPPAEVPNKRSLTGYTRHGVYKRN